MIGRQARGKSRMSAIEVTQAPLAALSERELTALKERADGPGLLRLAAHLMLLAATGWIVLAAPVWPLWLAASLAHGVVLVFLFTALHECIHGTAFRTAWIHSLAAEAFGFLLLLPPRHFRYFHFAHHRHTQDPLRDPELATPKPASWPAYLWHLTGIGYWKAELKVLLHGAIGRNLPAFVPANGHAKVIREARGHLAGYAVLGAASWAFGWTWPLWLWVVPALLGQPFLRAFLLAEHTGCPLVAEMLANTRTTFTNRLVQFLAWNMPHHTAHHVLPSVPFHRLPRLTGLLCDRLSVTAPGYLAAQRQIASDWR
jgi:fatty acid desaturase